MGTTATSESKQVPPVDTNGESDRANLALKRFRRELEKAKLPPAWQRWVVNSLEAGLPKEQQS